MTRLTNAFISFVIAAAMAACGRVGADTQRPGSGSAPMLRTEALELRRVWAGPNPNFYPSTPSPDGRLMTEIDWSTGDLAVIELESGRLRRVTDKGPWSQSGDYAEFSVFSPDGQRLAYSWFSGVAKGYQVREIGLDGTGMRVLLPRRAEHAYVAVEDWSRDGSSLLVIVFRTDRSVQIGTVNVADGAYRALETHDWRPPSVLTFSPDGRFIAYDLVRAGAPGERDIFVIAADGSGKTTVVGSGGDNRLLGWLPDGRGLLYHRRGADSRAVMALPIADGRPAGPPQVVRPDVMGLDPLGFSRDAYYYGLSTELPQVHVVDVDLATGRALTEPSPLGDPADGAGHDAAWAPDGQMVAAIVNAPGGARLVVRNLAGQIQRQLFVSLSQARKMRWAPDGSALLVYGTDLEGRVGIHRVDLRTSAQTPLLTGGPGGETEGMAFWSISPDGQTIYHRAPRMRDAPFLGFMGPDKVTQAGHVIVAHDLGTGRSRELVSVDRPGRTVSASPDGAWVAFTVENQPIREAAVLIVPSAGGAPREVYRQRGGRGLGNRGAIEWAPDGSSILIYNAPTEGRGGIWQVPISGGSPRLLLDDSHLTPLTAGERGEPRNFRLSADGRRVAYEAGRTRGEIWMLSGFAAATR